MIKLGTPLFLIPVLFLVACSGTEDEASSNDVEGSGGQESSNAGGATTGGQTGLGGQPSTGGVVDAGGGSSNSGGTASSSGGQFASGGAEPSAGGGPASGGAPSGGGGTNGGSGGTSVGGGSGGSLPSSDVTVWIAGDSTVANGNTPCPRGWGGVIAPLFIDGVTVNNAAVGGRSVRTWMNYVQSEMGGDGECLRDVDGAGVPLVQDRWQTMLDEMDEGDFLLIQFGINDGSATCDRHVGLDAFKESYREMAEAAAERGAEAIFLTPVSAISCQGATAQGTRGGFVTATKEIGTEMGVAVIDLHQLSVDLYNERGFCPLPDAQSDVGAETGGDVGAFFCDDHTHFDQTGAVAIAEVIAQALRDQAIALGEYLL
jgi:lysophospholipase L1-like esterase